MALSSQTTLYLCSNIPLDREYKYVLNPSECYIYNYVTNNSYGYLKYTDAYANIVLKTGKIRTNLTLNQVKECSYIAWINTLESHMYYAWIDDIYYISDNCTEISYTIDIWSTWVLPGWDTLAKDASASLANLAIPCMTRAKVFVVRKHIQNDKIGVNWSTDILDDENSAMFSPENLNLGAYYATHTARYNLQPSAYYNYISTLMICTSNGENSSPSQQCNFLGYAFNGLFYRVISTYSLGTYENTLKLYNDNPDEILSMISIPKLMADNLEGTFSLTLSQQYGEGWENYKCYMYPYTKFEFSNNTGGSIEGAFENAYLVSGGAPTVQLYGAMVTRPTPEVAMWLRNYSGVGDNLNALLKINNFPQCAWSTNYFENWYMLNQASIDYSNSTAQRDFYTVSQYNAQSTALAQKSTTVSSVGAVASGTSGVIGNLLKGNLGGALSSGVNTATTLAQNTIKSQEINLNANYNQQQIEYSMLDTQFANQNAINVASMQPNIMKGQSPSGVLGTYMSHVGFDNYSFNLIRWRQRTDLMQQIDAYFHLYGYSFNKIISPHSDGKYQYLKVAGDLFVNGLSPCGRYKRAIPKEALSKLNEIARRGMWIWSDWGTYGDLSTKRH